MPDSISPRQELRFYGIPGNSKALFDPEIHGQPLNEEDLGSGDFAEIGWRPGEYSYSAGACGHDFIFQVPESAFRTGPQINVLKGIHEFLRYAHDQEV